MSRYAEFDVARVVASHGRHVVLETPDGVRLIARPRGKKSDCVVGDNVRWQPSADEGVIEAIEPRSNLLFRRDETRTKSFAANLDQIFIMVAGDPLFSESQLTRALIAARSAEIEAIILLNKVDLPQTALARERLAPYVRMGVPVVELALKTRPEEAVAILHPLLAHKVSLVLGPSGTGKSTLINLMVPHAKAQIGEISVALNSGRHTTTTTSWYWLDPQQRDTALIDSPGFQEFGLRQIDAQVLPRLMPDFAAHIGDCRFYNCTHRSEPGCGVRAAIERGEVAPSRHRIYLEILEELARERW